MHLPIVTPFHCCVIPAVPICSFAWAKDQWFDFSLPLPICDEEFTTVTNRHVITICSDVKAVLIGKQNGEH